MDDQQLKQHPFGKDIKTQPASFDEMLEFYKEYMRENPGSSVPFYTEYRGQKLGFWVHRKRQGKRTETINKDEEAKLKNAGFLWKAPIGTTPKRSWDAWLAYVKLFMEENNTKEVGPCAKYQDKTTGEIVLIGGWADRQRRAWRKRKLEDWKVRKLNDLNFAWDVSANRGGRPRKAAATTASEPEKTRKKKAKRKKRSSEQGSAADAAIATGSESVKLSSNKRRQSKPKKNAVPSAAADTTTLASTAASRVEAVTSTSREQPSTLAPISAFGVSLQEGSIQQEDPTLSDSVSKPPPVPQPVTPDDSEQHHQQSQHSPKGLVFVTDQLEGMKFQGQEKAKHRNDINTNMRSGDSGQSQPHERQEETHYVYADCVVKTVDDVDRGDRHSQNHRLHVENGMSQSSQKELLLTDTTNNMYEPTAIKLATTEITGNPLDKPGGQELPSKLPPAVGHELESDNASHPEQTTTVSKVQPGNGAASATENQGGPCSKALGMEARTLADSESQLLDEGGDEDLPLCSTAPSPPVKTAPVWSTVAASSAPYTADSNKLLSMTKVPTKQILTGKVHLPSAKRALEFSQENRQSKKNASAIIKTATTLEEASRSQTNNFFPTWTSPLPTSLKQINGIDKRSEECMSPKTKMLDAPVKLPKNPSRESTPDIERLVAEEDVRKKTSTRDKQSAAWAYGTSCISERDDKTTMKQSCEQNDMSSTIELKLVSTQGYVAGICKNLVRPETVQIGNNDLGKFPKAVDSVGSKTTQQSKVAKAAQQVDQEAHQLAEPSHDSCTSNLDNVFSETGVPNADEREGPDKNEIMPAGLSVEQEARQITGDSFQAIQEPATVIVANACGELAPHEPGLNESGFGGPNEPFLDESAGGEPAPANEEIGGNIANRDSGQSDEHAPSDKKKKKKAKKKQTLAKHQDLSLASSITEAVTGVTRSKLQQQQPPPAVPPPPPIMPPLHTPIVPPSLPPPIMPPPLRPPTMPPPLHPPIVPPQLSPPIMPPPPPPPAHQYHYGYPYFPPPWYTFPPTNEPHFLPHGPSHHCLQQQQQQQQTPPPHERMDSSGGNKPKTGACDESIHLNNSEPPQPSPPYFPWDTKLPPQPQDDCSNLTKQEAKGATTKALVEAKAALVPLEQKAREKTQQTQLASPPSPISIKETGTTKLSTSASTFAHTDYSKCGIDPDLEETKVKEAATNEVPTSDPDDGGEVVALGGNEDLQSATESKKKFHRSFDEMVSIFEKYKDEFGTAIVPLQTDYHGVKLGAWITNRRCDKKAGRLSKEEETLLDRAGFQWDLPASNRTAVNQASNPVTIGVNSTKSQEQSPVITTKRASSSLKPKLRLQKTKSAPNTPKKNTSKSIPSRDSGPTLKLHDTRRSRSPLPTSKLVWITFCGRKEQHPAVLLEKTQEKVRVQWSINQNKEWLKLAKIKLVYDKDQPISRSGRKRTVVAVATATDENKRSRTVRYAAIDSQAPGKGEENESPGNPRRQDYDDKGKSASRASRERKAMRESPLKEPRKKGLKRSSADRDITDCDLVWITIGSSQEEYLALLLWQSRRQVRVKWTPSQAEQTLDLANIKLVYDKDRHSSRHRRKQQKVADGAATTPRCRSHVVKNKKKTESKFSHAEQDDSQEEDIPYGTVASYAVDRPSRVVELGAQVEKHFPGEGRFGGNVVDITCCRASKESIYKVAFRGRKEVEYLTREKLNDYLPRLRLSQFDEFNKCWEKLKPEDIEKSSTIRQANRKISPCDSVSNSQTNAQYGRILPDGTRKIFDVLRLKHTDRFVDVGHGIGNMPLQAGFCVGCEARGIEVISDRFKVSQSLATQLDSKIPAMRLAGEIHLRHGDLSDIETHNWLVSGTKIFVNNYNGVFSERMGTGQDPHYHLDHYVAGIFASLKEGSLLISLTDLQLGMSQREVNAWRLANKLRPNNRGSFFEVVKVNIGMAKDIFSWVQSSEDPVHLFVYWRVKQNPRDRMSTILCCKWDCPHSKKATPIPAVTINADGKAVAGMCQACKYTGRSQRDIPIVSFEKFIDPTGDYCEWGIV